jgi:hypothetical protein
VVTLADGAEFACYQKACRRGESNPYVLSDRRV